MVEEVPNVHCKGGPTWIIPPPGPLAPAQAVDMPSGLATAAWVSTEAVSSWLFELEMVGPVLVQPPVVGPGVWLPLLVALQVPVIQDTAGSGPKALAVAWEAPVVVAAKAGAAPMPTPRVARPMTTPALRPTFPSIRPVIAAPLCGSRPSGIDGPGLES